jgi:hypothetical protein
MTHPVDPFARMLKDFQNIAAHAAQHKARAAIALVQEVRSRADIIKDADDLAHLDDIQHQASEILASKCGKVTSLEPLDHYDSCSFDDRMRDHYETMCADLTDLFLKLREPLFEGLDAVV